MKPYYEWTLAARIIGIPMKIVLVFVVGILTIICEDKTADRIFNWLERE